MMSGLRSKGESSLLHAEREIYINTKKNENIGGEGSGEICLLILNPFNS